MPDTTTPNILLTNQTEGANNNSWGTIADANFEEIDDKLGDVTAISTTGGNTVLTTGQEIVNAITVSGTLVSNAVIVFSGRGGTWVVRNATAGAYAVTCRVSGQPGVEIPQGTTQPVYSTGTDIAAAGAPSSAVSIPSGMMAPFSGTIAPSGWVRANGRTIGNAVSGATERAHADCEPLFTLLWNGHANTILPIFDSAGSVTTRGATAAADFAANKRLHLPDLRGRAPFGLDDMGNSTAGRITTSSISSPTTLGASLGFETVTLGTAEIPAHVHTGPSHAHTFSTTTGSGGVDHTHAVSGSTGFESANHTHAVSGSTGSSAIDHAHPVSITTGGESAEHTHAFSATTSSDGAHSHNYGTNNPLNAAVGGSASIFGQSGVGTYATTTSGTHSHTISGTTNGRSAGHTHDVVGSTGANSTTTAHTHTFSATTGTVSANHTHAFSVTSGSASNVSHTHSVSGTTDSSGTGSTGSTGGGSAHHNMPPFWLITWLIKV